MGNKKLLILGLISILSSVDTRGIQPFCESNGTFYDVGDEWIANPFSMCKCTNHSSIKCSKVCIDYQKNLRKPGDQWLEDPTTYCNCTEQSSVKCEVLNGTACIDIKGNLRKNRETWINSSCVDCSCINGSINCTRYDVNISYGLYSVELLPTCEKCDIPWRALQRISTCTVYREHLDKGKLFDCTSGGFFIQDIHRCNGINECPDKSDEEGCENVVCKDEEGSLFRIKDKNGWQVSECMNCHCKEGLLSCRRTLTINFPAHYDAMYPHKENCTQPNCNVAKFVREKRDYCEGIEFIENDGIYLKGQTWKSSGCDFYFPGAFINWKNEICPPMNRPVCYVYNGAICCAAECPGLKQIADQLRDKFLLTLCPNGRQVSGSSDCKDSNLCLQNFDVQNCSSEVTCQDEDSIQYFEGATWSVGKCIQCSCNQGNINCSRKVVAENVLFEHCNQSDYCNVANFMKRNNGKCSACRWNSELYYDGDHWEEIGVDFYCRSSNKKVRPGCYVDNNKANCTGAILGIRDLSLISNGDLFLCESGDEIISLGRRCDVRPDCEDKSDERNCVYYCDAEMVHGVLMTRTREGREVIKRCSIINSELTGTFSSKCIRSNTKMIWLHKNTCDCEKKTLVVYFKKKIAAVNETNFMEISKDLATSAQAGNFTNSKVFHDMLEVLFHNVTRMLTPLTLQNTDVALQFYKHFISTVRSSPIYKQAFCKHKLERERYLLAEEALKFLRQAPENTTAYVYVNLLDPSSPPVIMGLRINYGYADFNIDEGIDRETGSYYRRQLFLHNELNTAPLLRTNMVGPSHVNINAKNNVTTGNDTSLDENKTTSGNTTQQLTNEQIRIQSILSADICTGVRFDEGMGVFVYNEDASETFLKHHEIQSNMELVLLCISTSATVLALILLTVLRLKTSEKLFIHKSLLLALGLGNLVYVLDIKLFASRKELPALCTAVTVVQFFFHTALFTWMLVEGINLYIKLVKVFSMEKRYIAYMAVGWGIPAVIAGLIAAVRPSTFDMEEVHYKDIPCGSLHLTVTVQRTRCWINGSLWIYKGPVSAILVANLVLFVILLRVIFGKLATKYSKDHVKVTKGGLKSTVALLPLLGVTWLLGFFIKFHIAVGYAFVLLNSTQGILFFIFHCVLDDEVQDAVRKLVGKNKANVKTRGTPAFNPNNTPAKERNSRVKIRHDLVKEKQFLEVIDVQPQLSILSDKEHDKESDNAECKLTADDLSSTRNKATLGGGIVVEEIAV